MCGRPPGDLELGVAGLITVLDPVAVLEEDLAVATDKHRSERLVAVVQCLAGQLDAAPQVGEVGLGDAHGHNRSNSVSVAPPESLA